MDQISRLIFDVQGRDRGGSKVLNDAAAASDRAHVGFSKLSSALSGLGGPFGAVVNFASQMGDALDAALSRSQKFGLGLTAIGVGLTALGNNQSQRQLQQAIENTGASFTDYRDQIDEAIKHEEQFAHTSTDTQNALNVLVTALQDPQQALAELGDAANLAAEKHEALSEAATQLVQAQQGNARALKSLGISLDGVGSKTGQVNRALEELHRRLSGQASASVDTFSGRLKVAETRIRDTLSNLGKYGPELAVAGAALTVYASALQLKAARQIADAAATAQDTEANVALAASYDAVAASATAATGAVTAEAGAASRAAGLTGVASKGIGRFALPVAIAGGAYEAFKGLQNVRSDAQNRSGILKGLEDALTGNPVTAPLTAPIHLVQHFLGGGGKSADAQAADAAAKANRQLDAALSAQKTAANAAAVSLQGQIKALDAATGKAMSLSSAQDDLQAAMHAMAQSAHDGGKALDGSSLAAESNRNTIRDAVQKYLDFIQAEKDAGVKGEDLRQIAIQSAKALEHQATQIFGNKTAVDQLLGSLKVLPGQMRHAFAAPLDGVFSDMTDFFNRMDSNFFAFGQDAGNSYWAGFSGTGSNSPFRDPGHPGYVDPNKTKDAAKKAGQQVAHQVVDSFAPVVTDGVDKATNDALQKAKSNLQSAESEILGAFRSMRDQIVGGFDVANLEHTDALGFTGLQDPRRAAHAFVQQLEEWANLIGRLRRKGLNETMLEQFEAAGVAAIPAMREVLRQHEIPALNRAERHIRRIGSQVSADFTGDQYSAEIARLLQHLPRHLANELEKLLRHLNIVTDTDKQDVKQGHKVAAG